MGEQPGLNGSGFSRDDVLRDYRVAVRSREVDDAEKRLVDAKKAKFCILSGGQELAQIASVRPLRPGDWVRGFYRSGTEPLALGVVTARQMFAQVIADTLDGHDPASGGRMMGRHVGSRLLDAQGQPIDYMQQVNRASDISSTGSQMPVAFGLARASNVFREVPELASYTGLSNRGHEVALVSVGDASMAEGVSYEAIAQAVVQRVPLVISVLDNKFGISVPVEKQVPHGSISKALKGFQPNERIALSSPVYSGITGSQASGLEIIGPVEGWDYFRLRAAYDQAYGYVRETGNPALVHAIVTQPFGHSSSGDHTRYKSAERLQWERDNDCLKHMRRWLMTEHFATADELDVLEKEEREFVEGEARAAWSEYYEPIKAMKHEAMALLSEMGLDKRAADLESLASGSGGITRGDIVEALEGALYDVRRAAGSDGVAGISGVSVASGACYERALAMRDSICGQAREDYSSHVYAEGDDSPCVGEFVAPEYLPTSDSDTGAHIVAAGLATIMSEDPRVVLFGEDTGRLGGVQTHTLGLQCGRAGVKESIWDRAPALRRYIPEKGFGPARVWDHAIAENTIVGGAVGMALRGLRPIAEIQYFDYAVWALQQMVDEVACLRHRTDNGQACPMLIRTHGHQLLGMWHSGSPMGMILSSCPGLRVLVPRNGAQAVGMYRAVLESGDPAFSVESLGTSYVPEQVPENLDDVRVPLGQSEVLRAGTDVTIITYAHTCCEVAMEAAERLAARGISAEVVDLQTLNPLDLNGVAAQSMKKTGKVVFLDEDIPEGAMSIVSKTLLHERDCFDYLDGMTFVTAPHHKPPYGRDGKFFGKPQARDVVAATLKMFDDLDGKKRMI